MSPALSPLERLPPELILDILQDFDSLSQAVNVAFCSRTLYHTFLNLKHHVLPFYLWLPLGPTTPRLLSTAESLLRAQEINPYSADAYVAIHCVPPAAPPRETFIPSPPSRRDLWKNHRIVHQLVYIFCMDQLDQQWSSRDTQHHHHHHHHHRPSTEELFRIYRAFYRIWLITKTVPPDEEEDINDNYTSLCADAYWGVWEMEEIFALTKWMEKAVRMAGKTLHNLIILSGAAMSTRPLSKLLAVLQGERKLPQNASTLLWYWYVVRNTDILLRHKVRMGGVEPELPSLPAEEWRPWRCVVRKDSGGTEAFGYKAMSWMLNTQGEHGGLGLEMEKCVWDEGRCRAWGLDMPKEPQQPGLD